MTDRAAKPASAVEREEEEKGPNLFLVYSLLALGLLAAMAVAAMIVWPFYVRR
jgi:hypothetical protein